MKIGRVIYKRNSDPQMCYVNVKFYDSALRVKYNEFRGFPFFHHPVASNWQAENNVCNIVCMPYFITVSWRTASPQLMR